MKIPADHPALPGHFPGQPVVPGVILLSEVIAAYAVLHPEGAPHASPHKRVCGFKQVKFMAPLLPERSFSVEFSSRKPSECGFTVQSEGMSLAMGTLMLEGGRP